LPNGSPGPRSSGASSFQPSTSRRSAAIFTSRWRAPERWWRRVFNECQLAEFVDRVSVLREKTPSAARRQVLGAAVAGVRFGGKLELPPIKDPH
jgi:hypothetical protein